MDRIRSKTHNLLRPFTGVKEQVVGAYAARLHERGLTTLAFDHRGFGESGGRRAHEGSQASSPTCGQR
jgi:fermentation-respiration switch protein FrsA (DUF1100 family)